jgi:hypothetical protein
VRLQTPSDLNLSMKQPPHLTELEPPASQGGRLRLLVDIHGFRVRLESGAFCDVQTQLHLAMPVAIFHQGPPT